MIRNALYTALIASMLVFSTPSAQAEAPRITLSASSPAMLPFARQHLVTSQATGRGYRIQVSPVGKAPPGGYPLVLVLDGDIMLPIVAAAAQGMHMAADENGVGPMLIVGVGYDKAELLDEHARADDYTPPAPDLSQTGDTRATKQGGADRFLRFLRDELKPAIAAAYPVDASKTALLGHSYGGLFALYALLQQPALAQTYVASSPSAWWNKAYITQELERRTADSLPAARVRLSIGEYEQTPSPRIDAQSPRARMMITRGQVRHARLFAERLRERQPRVTVEFAEYPQATHATSALYGIVDGLQFISTK